MKVKLEEHKFPVYELPPSIYEVSDDSFMYPCTVIYDRYGGTYSGGKWVAIDLEPNDVPEEIGGDDFEEMCFYSDYKDYVRPYTIGVGATPDEAVLDLHTKKKEKNEST